ncbi:MAG TPA: 5-methyltetrahydropteroyltriglutamate--homocysteine S-methyltransferase [Methylomirabilota bacterium]|nr:5-methyltetrahydropteroyltriglutamate--homocysteine S-methyltransferase [Methylomirabilota bacterium]
MTAATPTRLVGRADHIGSLLRPRALKDAYQRLSAGELDAAGFAEVLDGAIREAIRRQEAAGLGAVTDGEFRRRSWFAGFVDSVDGLVHRDTHVNFMEGEADSLSVPVPHTEGRIRRTRGIATAEFAFARSVATRPVKITLPSPSVIHFFRGPDGVDRRVYPDEETYWGDLLAVYRAEITELGRLGCRYVQLDEVPMALLCDAKIRDRLAGWGWDWRRLLARYVWAANEAIHDRPPDMVVGMHMCRGNFRGHWIGSGGYEPVAEAVFAGTGVDVFLLEYDSPRAGDFRPLRFVPPGKAVVLGLVTTKHPALEPDAALRRRIDEAANVVPLERLALSPQCGFGTTVGGTPMTEAEQWQKLGLVGRVAAAVWG